MVPLHFAEGVVAGEVDLDTLDEVGHRLLHILAEDDVGTKVLVVDEVGEAHQKVAVADSVLDSSLRHRLAVLPAHDRGVCHIDLIQPAQDVARRLPRHSVAACLKLLKDRLEDQVLRRLLRLTVQPARREAVLKDFVEGDGEGVPDVVVGFLEEHVLHGLDDLLDRFRNCRRNVSQRILEVCLEHARHVAKEACVELQEFETTCRGRFRHLKKILVAKCAQKDADYLWALTVFRDQLLAAFNS